MAIFYQLPVRKESPSPQQQGAREHSAEQSCSEAERWNKDTGSDDVGLGTLNHFSCLPQVANGSVAHFCERSSIRKGKEEEVVHH